MRFRVAISAALKDDEPKRPGRPEKHKSAIVRALHDYVRSLSPPVSVYKAASWVLFTNGLASDKTSIDCLRRRYARDLKSGVLKPDDPPGAFVGMVEAHRKKVAKGEAALAVELRNASKLRKEPVTRESIGSLHVVCLKRRDELEGLLSLGYSEAKKRGGDSKEIWHALGLGPSYDERQELTALIDCLQRAIECDRLLRIDEG